MPNINIDSEITSALAIFVAHFFERMDTMNTILAEIADRLDGIEKRLSYATALDCSE